VLKAVAGLDTVRLSSRDSVPLFLGKSLGLILSRSQP
jgi:hypothetical protein